MKFWDTSAVVPLCVAEPRSHTVASILVDDKSMVVWWATPVECISALMRQTREGAISRTGEREARHLLELLTGMWVEVQPADSVRATAGRLLAVHPLRAADALQLAAAWHWCDGRTKDACLVSFDVRLREAAYKEGFTLLPA